MFSIWGIFLGSRYLAHQINDHEIALKSWSQNRRRHIVLKNIISNFRAIDKALLLTENCLPEGYIETLSVQIT